MSRAEERARAQWFKAGDQIRFVPVGQIAEEVGIDRRSAVELPREPQFGERFIGTRGRSHVSASARAARALEAERNSRGWHDDVDRELEALRERVAKLEAQLGAMGVPGNSDTVEGRG